MNLESIVSRVVSPEPWAEGDNIPWNDPQFSERMLREHLSQSHHAASRPFPIIDKQVEWIKGQLLPGKAARILDLACGPGLYSSRLSASGHSCTAIDYSPASVAYAKREASERGLSIHYHQEDLRQAEFPKEQELVMLLFGELNVFSSSDARQLLQKAADCLGRSGRLLLEVHAPGVLQRKGQSPPDWYSSGGGLWSDAPHLCLMENFWSAGRQTAISRFHIIDAATGATEMHSASYQDYSDQEYEAMLLESGFRHVVPYPSLVGVNDEEQRDFAVFVAEK